MIFAETSDDPCDFRFLPLAPVPQRRTCDCFRRPASGERFRVTSTDPQHISVQSSILNASQGMRLNALSRVTSAASVAAARAAIIMSRGESVTPASQAARSSA